jgi:parallel beta-helix repeat protein
MFNNAAGNSIQSNLIWQSSRDGIRAEVSSNNTIERNIVVNSAEHDAHDDSNGTGTAGTANLWTDNLCGSENRLGLCAFMP